VIKLPPGPVYFEISKGFEIEPIRRVVEVGPDTTEILFSLEKVLPWRERGWVTADTHVHFLSPSTAGLEGSAEGVNVVNLLASQWGELMTNVGDFDGKTTFGSRESGGDGEWLVRVGTENRQHVLGHMSLLGYRGSIIAPMCTGGPDEAAIGDPIETLLMEWAAVSQAGRTRRPAPLPHHADRPEMIAAHSSPVMVRVGGSDFFSAPDALVTLDQIEGALAYLDTVGTRAEDEVYKRMRLKLTSAYGILHRELHQRGHLHEHSPVTDHDAHHP